MGTIMMVTWMLILGPIGAVLLGAVAYSMLAKNPIQGVLCGILLFLPLFLTIAWGIERWPMPAENRTSKERPFFWQPSRLALQILQLKSGKGLEVRL